MANAIHFICGQDDQGRPKHVTFDPASRSHWSGNWFLSVDDADRLVGGWLYLHVTKASPSYYGGVITGARPVVRDDVAKRDRIAFRVDPRADAKGHRWRGAAHGRAWTGGIVAADLPHELG